MNKILLVHRDYPAEQLDMEFDSDQFNQLGFWSRHRLVYGHYIHYTRNNRPSQCTSKFDTSVPDYTKFNNVSFADATDQRAIELVQELSKNNLPIQIFWSGGIDSTLIVAAVYKNFPKEMLDRVTIVMNNSSYVENPFFFKKIIEPTFKFTAFPKYDFTNSVILHGDLADALWLQGNVITLSQHADVIHDNIYRNPTNVFKLFSNCGVEQDKVEWAIDFLVENAKISNIELTTTADIMWWANFSMQYETMCNKRLDGIDLSRINSHTVDLYFKNFKQWYMSTEYQVWSIQAQFNLEKFDNSVRSYKMPAKDYIFSIDSNQYYRDYKTKMISGYAYHKKEKIPFVIYENGKVSYAQ
jgi:hypothetical protein